jgi:hypothetical protein
VFLAYILATPWLVAREPCRVVADGAVAWKCCANHCSSNMAHNSIINHNNLISSIVSYQGNNGWSNNWKHNILKAIPTNEGFPISKLVYFHVAAINSKLQK